MRRDRLVAGAGHALVRVDAELRARRRRGEPGARAVAAPIDARAGPALARRRRRVLRRVDGAEVHAVGGTVQRGDGRVRRAVRAVVPDGTIGRRGPVVARGRGQRRRAEHDALRVRRVALLGERERGRAPVLADVVGHSDGVGAVRFCSDGVGVGAPGRGDRDRSVAHARRPAVGAAARFHDSPMKHVRELRRRLDFQIMTHAGHGADAATYVLQ